MSSVLEFPADGDHLALTFNGGEWHNLPLMLDAIEVAVRFVIAKVGDRSLPRPGSVPCTSVTSGSSQPTAGPSFEAAKCDLLGLRFLPRDIVLLAFLEADTTTAAALGGRVATKNWWGGPANWDGFQIGVEAKLRLSTEVVRQAFQTSRASTITDPNPECRAILVPKGAVGADMAKLCACPIRTVIGLEPGRAAASRAICRGSGRVARDGSGASRVRAAALACWTSSGM